MLVQSNFFVLTLLKHCSSVTFNFFDASEGRMYYNVGSAQPVVQSLVNLADLNITGDGDICSTDGFAFGASEFCLEANGCELTQYCNGEPTANTHSPI